MSEWHERDDFWSAFGGAMFDAAAWEAAEGQVDDLVELLAMEPGARVLDLCCGPGRHTLELARRGFVVTGVDRTEEYLEECRRRADDEGLDVDLAHADMREFVDPGVFDIAINLLTSFGYFPDPADDARVLSNLFESLVPGGRLVLDTIGKEVIARIYQARDWRELEGDFYLYERTVRDGWSWMENRWIRIGVTGRDEYTVGHRLFSAGELCQLVRDAGFEAVRAYGRLDGSPYDVEARRLVVTARKPGGTPG